MAAIEATRPAFWVQLAASAQQSTFSIQPLNLIRAFRVHSRPKLPLRQESRSPVTPSTPTRRKPSKKPRFALIEKAYPGGNSLEFPECRDAAREARIH